MKNFWISLSFLCLIGRPLAAQDTLTLYQLYPSLSEPEKAEWTAFLNNWSYFDYAMLQKKHHIKAIDCKDCESFYAELYVEIDIQGKVSAAVCRKAMRCGNSSRDAALFADYEASVRLHEFRKLLNRRFIVRLGQVLKC